MVGQCQRCVQYSGSLFWRYHFPYYGRFSLVAGFLRHIYAAARVVLKSVAAFCDVPSWGL